MSISNQQPPLAARNGRSLLVLCIARISTEHQDQRSLKDQEALCRGWLAERGEVPFEVKVISSRGSGERLDRAESRQAEAEVESGAYDLVITEDLGRIFRRVKAFDFCEICEDQNTRLIAINDHLDTGQDGWRLTAFFATLRHELYNADTGKRIRRSLRNRFVQGGVVQTFPFGYIKPPGAKSDSDIEKDPQAEAIIDEIFRRLEDGASYGEVADWLNAQGVPPGPYVRSKRWTSNLVFQLVYNPIYKGLRVRNKRMSKRINQTGRRKSVEAPASERLERWCPHLAFVEPERYDRVIAALNARNKKFRRKGIDGVDQRKNVPKKRTIWPGQHLYCGICGRMFRYGGHGVKDHLECGGGADYLCWNSVSVDGPLAASRICAAILSVVESLPNFDEVLGDQVARELENLNSSRDRRLAALQHQLSGLEQERDNLVAAICAGGEIPSLVGELQGREPEIRQLQAEMEQIRRTPSELIELPSTARVRELAHEAMARQVDSPYEFGRIMHRLTPKIFILPFRLCDGGKVVPRAKFTLSLAALVEPDQRLDSLDSVLCRELVVDLFNPPQREAHRTAIVDLVAQGLTFKAAGLRVGITGTAAQHAVALQRLMDAQGLVDPYLPVREPPADLTKLRRHLHPRYRFEPLEGYPLTT